MLFYRPFIIPIVAGILGICSLIAVYILSVEEDLVYSSLPSIADLLPIERAGTSNRPIETPSYLMQWFLLVFSLLFSAIVYIRYRQLRYVCANPDMEDKATANNINRVALCTGWILAVCLMILPYFINYFDAQYMATLVWLLILLYESLDVFISVMVYEELKIKGKIRIIIIFKLVLLVAGILLLIASKAFWEIAMRRFAPENLASNYASWHPGDFGYNAHFISALCEWIFAIVTFCYFCILMTADFMYISFREPEMDIRCGRCH